MNKILHKLIRTVLVCTLLIVSSCKSFLDIEPVGSLTGEKLFTNVEGYTSAMVGSYSLFTKYHLSNYGLYGELRGDNVLLNQTLGMAVLAEYNYESDPTLETGPVRRIWESIYETLNNVNNVIESRASLLKDFPGSTANIERIYGEALVLRAMCFFDLANIYSQTYSYSADASHLGVPIFTKTPLPGVNTPRSTIKETYTRIIDDLKEAQTVLSNNNVSKNKIYVSADAATALLSRVYLYMQDWDGVIGLLENPTLKTKYPLVSSSQYMDMFMGTTQRTNPTFISSEVIWQLNLHETSISYLTDILSNPETFYVYPHATYRTLFENTDVRSTQFVANPRNTSMFYTLKYGKADEVVRANWPVNFKMFRSAEIYLNLAEAYYHKQQYELAANQVKVVRARAYNVAPETITLSSADPAVLLQQIKLERRKELGFENQRIFDIMRYKESLNRTECNSNTCTLTFPNNKFVLPIPDSEILANPLIKQNPL
ncbi:MAG: RagB/SusD family nutrient uptake outer membrane protein [Flavobacteriales bacterium]|nr:MAG: RagB/SusD family nutrient uptake outer membrane protein [Flavobacteriales bacterium]